MYFRSKLTIRTIAALGIVLASMGSLQQGHGLCALLGCGCETVATCGSATKAVSKSCRCCSSSCKTANRPSRGGMRSNGNPSNQDCWCCQPPAARVAPQKVTAAAKSSFSKLFIAIPSYTCRLAITPRDEIRSVTQSLLLLSSSGHTCARLCRFLI